ncbi:MAG: ydjZ 4 [Planctomycetaceae bacterium]|nr:ydjZ 4 [Planctomycetaceae bacterium]
MTEPDNTIQPPPTRRGRWLLLAAGGVLLVASLGVLLSGGIGQASSAIFELLIALLTQLRQAQTQHPVAVYCGAFVLYVVVAGLSLPGAAIMTLAYGWMFRFWPALILVSLSSTTGATVAFLMSRYLLRDVIQHRFGQQLAGFNAAFEREGAFYLFTLRLIPAAPFFVVNAGMGLTPISVRTYWWVSQLGMLPGTILYVYAGTSLPGLDELKNPSVTKILSPQLLIAFTVLGLFPLLVKKIATRFVRPSVDN